MNNHGLKKYIKRIVLEIIEKIIPLFRNTSSLRQVSTIKRENIKKILIFEGGGVGDLLRLFPAIESMYRNFPTASFSLLLRYPKTMDLFPLKDFKYNVIEYDLEEKYRGILRKLLLVKQMRKESFDLIYNPSRGEATREATIISYLMGGKYRIGFFRDNFGFLNNIFVPLEGERPIAHQNIELLKEAGLEVINNEITISIPEKDIQYAEKVLNTTRGTKICVHIGVSGQKEYRAWPLNYFVEMIKKLITWNECKIVLIGSKKELDIKKQLLLSIDSASFINLIGETTITQMAAVIHFSDIFVGVDSGPLHIATILKKPLVALFGPTAPEQVLSYFENNNIIIRKEIPCSPCYLHQSNFNPKCKAVVCMNLITVDEVLEAIKKLLEKRK